MMIFLIAIQDIVVYKLYLYKLKQNKMGKKVKIKELLHMGSIENNKDFHVRYDGNTPAITIFDAKSNKIYVGEGEIIEKILNMEVDHGESE